MITIEEIEQAVANLPPEQLAEFRAWFAHFDAESWDRTFEEDVLEGRLSALGDEALRNLDEERCTDL